MSILDKIKVLRDLEEMFQKRSYHVIIHDSCIYLDEYCYDTSIMDFREIQFLF